jgi:hypothetical protein
MEKRRQDACVRTHHMEADVATAVLNPTEFVQ